MTDKKFVHHYSMVCRTCLQSNVEMVSLCALVNDNIVEQRSKISYMECLKMCIEVEETADIEMPQRICLECASALQVSYWFTKNACQAQELLKGRLIEIRRKKLLQIATETAADIKKTKRYRCKICNVKVETKRSLKDHVKLHLDIIVYNCQLCPFESHNRNSLCDHYLQIHCMEATKAQLKPKTKLSTASSSSCKITAHDSEDGAIKNEYFQILPEDSQQISNPTLTKQSITTNSLCDTESLQVSTIMSANPSDTTISESFNALEGEINDNDMSIANEFIVMSDGSLEKVVNKRVVIEYINTPNNNSNLTLDNGLVLDNIVEGQNMDDAVMLEQQNVSQMDVDDLIIEDPCDVIEDTLGNVLLPLEEDSIPASFIEQPKKIMCKICTKDFLTQEQLKYHMLTHNEIPHFFCDQCKFYTFFKIDLHQHYKSKHNLQPTNKQLQPKNKQKTFNEFYACDLCFYEAQTKFDLKKHYKTKHNIEANEIHIKPIRIENLKSKLSPPSAKEKAAAIVNKIATAEKNFKIQYSEQSQTPDYPNGLNCRKCHKLFYWRNKLYEHYKMHNAEEAALKKEKQLTKIQKTPISSNLYQNKDNKATKTTSVETLKIPQTQIERKNTPTYSSLGTLALNITTPNISTLNSVTPLTPSSSSTYTLPSDAIPQIVETDQTIENMDFDFNCDDVLFEDFGDDVDVENDSDENDSEFRNVLLTSDDDFEDMLQDQNDVNNDSADAATGAGSHCAQCQKSFLSQYQFENHMFVHRGLAPYRCEMCTNIYNTKRCLIRHYKAVHKNVPTRDMIQAKGDKVCDYKTPVEHLQLEPTTCLMCAKCPYESSELNNIQIHLKSSHNINDDSYIMKKLPFECPRCIRSFATKMKLLRHLERNHSLITINQYQLRFNSGENTSAIATTTSVTTITTTTSNHVNMLKTETSEAIASCGKINKDIVAQQQQQQQHYKSDGLTLHNNMTLFEETTSPTADLAYNDISSNSNNNMPSTSNTFAPTALDENDAELALFKCKLCSLTCYNLAAINEHSKRIECRKSNVSSSGGKILFECEICHCNYKTMYLLKHHLKRHIGRKFLCADCPKTFINKVELEAHKHAHSGERPHKCDVCMKSFRYSHHLKRHKDSVHFGKRHACTEPNCSRKFTTRGQLKGHIWNHSGIVPYKCPFCNRLFKKRRLLREHCIKTHYVDLTEAEMANIFRNSLGYTNPHDFTVIDGNGKMLRRGDLETMAASGVIKSSFK